MTGRLVTCEGIDGSGKSTAARSLVDELRAQGRDARLHVEPTKTWLGESVRRAIREDVAPWTEALLFMADHATHVGAVKGEIAQGALVVSDRWSDSTFAYQGAALGDMGLLQRMEEPFDLRPDITLLFDLDPVVAMERVGRRGADQEKFERVDFLARVRANYLRLAKADPQRFVVLDAARPADAVLKDALAAVLSRGA
ncbi:MAG TPA: dTMP kinase [Candidatus Thermoplasmatota archaeon]|nr:dTMP kinase [Candidatus Thermoplasmatota archaeon]